MKKQYIYSALVLTALLSAGCAKEIENTLDGSDSSAIELSSVSTDPMTKAVITGTEFTTTEAGKGIGLFLLDGNGKAYGSNKPNVKYYHSGSKWVADSPLRVGGTSGKLYGYYPYSEGITDIAAIPVESSIDGTDYLYAAPVEVNSSNAKNVSLSLSHALARVSLSFKLDGTYNGSGALSSISLSGDCVAASGTLNAKTGGIVADASKFSAETNQTLSKTASTTLECLVVPVPFESGTTKLKIACTIDGKVYATTFTGDLAALAPGKQTTIELTVQNTSLSVDGSSIGAWGDGGTQTVTVGGNYTVTIQLDEDIPAHDVLAEVYVDVNSVIVKAYSSSGQRLKCTMPDGEFCTSQSKTDNMVYTFTISDITENTTATIGYANLARSISVSPENAGHVEIEGLQYSTRYFEGETFKHKAIPNEGYCFVNWQDQYGNVLCESEEYTFRPSSKVDVTAVFDISYSLKVFVSPSYAGSISAFSNWNVEGTEISLTTTSETNYFIGWKDKDGNILSDEKTYTFTIESDTILIADYSVDYGTDALDGTFTVAADNGYGKPKKVRFSKGNLWYGKTSEEATSATFNFEENQWDFKVSSEGNRLDDHISHFMWSKDAFVTYQQTYSDPQASDEDVFFTNSTNFTVNGASAWHSISQLEWSYLLGDSAERRGKNRTGITVNGVKGLVIAPDDFNGTISDEYDASEWASAEINDGLVFLPAAGYRSGFFGGTNINFAGSFGYYWSASSSGYDDAYGLYFSSGDVDPSHSDSRFQAYAVRLVTECQSEPSAE